MTITVNDIMALPPCSDYPRERVEALWGDRESLTRSEILDLPIPAADRVWAGCHMLTLDEALQAADDFQARPRHPHISITNNLRRALAEHNLIALRHVIWRWICRTVLNAVEANDMYDAIHDVNTWEAQIKILRHYIEEGNND